MVTTGGYNISSLVVRSPKGETRKVRLSANAYLGIVAATNMKQRTRKQLEYYHADRLNFAVIGTPNLLNTTRASGQNADGAADIKPIAHLYKSQVYQLAAHLGVPAEILSRPPTTDTYSLPQTQEEFYFALPYGKCGHLPLRPGIQSAGGNDCSGDWPLSDGADMDGHCRQGRPLPVSARCSCLRDKQGHGKVEEVLLKADVGDSS